MSNQVHLGPKDGALKMPEVSSVVNLLWLRASQGTVYNNRPLHYKYQLEPCPRLHRSSSPIRSNQKQPQLTIVTTINSTMKFTLASIVVFVAALATSVAASARPQAREINHRETHGYLDIALPEGF
ncbi:hypothetical protein CVT26_002936 [Gymnopilus dilepis]|uniref:Uncharacterized protein n=1 Tax=Gymnopilus dilepis TaxID=231916 RepID=A0A409VQU8_9AGAR|nr:hypothetical protein CVT26_002936 [Gymnopilus dilepis]